MGMWWSVNAGNGPSLDENSLFLHIVRSATTEWVLASSFRLVDSVTEYGQVWKLVKVVARFMIIRKESLAYVFWEMS